jgi:hypothetical protein
MAKGNTWLQLAKIAGKPDKRLDKPPDDFTSVLQEGR